VTEWSSYTLRVLKVQNLAVEGCLQHDYGGSKVQALNDDQNISTLHTEISLRPFVTADELL